MTVRLGTNPIGWSNDDLRELGGETPLETCLAEARLAGFAGIELGHKFPRDAAALRPILDRHGLALVSGWYSAHPVGTRRRRRTGRDARRIMTLLRALGCEVLILAETSNAIHGDRPRRCPAGPCWRTSEWPVFASRLTALADAVADAGLTIAYHHHMGTIVQTEAEIDRLMDMTGPSLKLAARYRPRRRSRAPIRWRWPAAIAAASRMSIARMSGGP